MASEKALRRLFWLAVMVGIIGGLLSIAAAVKGWIGVGFSLIVLCATTVIVSVGVAVLQDLRTERGKEPYLRMPSWLRAAKDPPFDWPPVPRYLFYFLFVVFLLVFMLLLYEVTVR